jgi:hypothetical protein
MSDSQLSRILTGLFVLGLSAASAHADITLDAYTNVSAIFQQTSSIAPVTPVGFTFAVEAAEPYPTFLPVALTYPGPGSPQALVGDPNNAIFTFSSSQYTSLNALHAIYPFGDYTFTATSGSTVVGQNTIHYTADYLPNVPTLATGTYDALQGLVPNAGVAVNYDGIADNAPGAPEGYAPTFTVFDATGRVWFYGSGGTGIYIPASTLPANTAFNFQLTYTNFLAGGAFTPSDNFFEKAFSTVDEGSFYTIGPAPEAAAFMPLAAGILMLGFVMRRKANHTHAKIDSIQA